MKVSIKICGMRERENIEHVANMKPDYMGFIFYARSPRFVRDNLSLFEVSSAVKRVGVFVNQTTGEILERVQIHGLEFVQLHGSESVRQCKSIRNEGVKLIKSFSVDDLFDFSATNVYKEVADFFLFDAKGKHPGGNAVTFDWNLLEQYDQEVPFFLSGGLSLKNVGRIASLNQMNIHAVDINSGVEDKPGFKNTALTQEIISKLRAL